MVEEKKINNEDINRIFLEKYGLHVNKIQPVQGGRSYVCKISTDKGAYILKQCLKDVSYETIATEVDVCNFLNKHGISTSEFLSIISTNNRYVTIQKFIPGHVYENNKAPASILFESGRILKDIRVILQGYPTEKIRWKPGWPFDADFDLALKELEIIKNSAMRAQDEFSRQILDDVDYKKGLIREIKNSDFIETNRLTYVNTHGDFSTRQLIVNENQNKISVIDFENFCKMPAVWEIIRSYSYASSECQNAIISRNKFFYFLEKSELNATLTEYDISKIFHFYAVQLLLNTYGYIEYYGENTIDRLNYIRFGVWRTKLLRSLMKIVGGSSPI